MRALPLWGRSSWGVPARLGCARRWDTGVVETRAGWVGDGGPGTSDLPASLAPRVTTSGVLGDGVP